jgi:hypothetical protein
MYAAGVWVGGSEPPREAGGEMKKAILDLAGLVV